MKVFSDTPAPNHSAPMVGTGFYIPIEVKSIKDAKAIESYLTGIHPAPHSFSMGEGCPDKPNRRVLTVFSIYNSHGISRLLDMMPQLPKAAKLLASPRG